MPRMPSLVVFMHQHRILWSGAFWDELSIASPLCVSDREWLNSETRSKEGWLWISWGWRRWWESVCQWQCSIDPDALRVTLSHKRRPVWMDQPLNQWHHAAVLTANLGLLDEVFIVQTWVKGVFIVQSLLGCVWGGDVLNEFTESALCGGQFKCLFLFLLVHEYDQVSFYLFFVVAPNRVERESSVPLI